ncbi:DUF5621 domain-containing protein [Legionella shakespearei]|uniref:Dot/Icm T4SS effector n=1 Tax=Legionella shakespearei DSM 23087 TaxID=1122169 RepID=A0A0W0YLF0_9GAMM|nr:DUF5621 domain-containing protein [Legionella shakespearei]KTD57722.1 Dot/Icm T4SS effector [Legionella shakespearei DSM 23087]
MATFTVFCYGTGESQAQTNNIISQFSKACRPGESTYIDGPGFLGTEVEANARRGANEIIEWLKGQDANAHNINLAGFSRGSVTSIYIANYLKEEQKKLAEKEQQLVLEGKQLDAGEKKLLTQLQNINLNLFLMDPVAGMTDKSKMDGRRIPDNVKSVVTVIQTDEMRRDFKPQDITRLVIDSPQTTKVSMLPMYGNHSDLIKIKNKDMTAGPQIAWHSLHQFLTQHGTRFTDDAKPQIVYSEGAPSDLVANPSAQQLLELFSQNHEQRADFLKSGMKTKLFDGMPVPRAPRSINEHLHFYVKNSDFFTNQLERELFKITYPKAFNYLFEKNRFDLRFPNDSASSKEDVEAELAILKRDNSKLFKRLVDDGHVKLTRGPIQQVDQISVIGPNGVTSLEPCATVQQMFPNLVTNDLIRQYAPEMNKLAQLEMDVYRATFNYQRNKSEANFAGERPEYDRAKEIRNEIQRLVNHHPGDDNTKFHRALDALEQHFIAMLKASSTSDLVPMLGKVLNKHGRRYQVSDPGLTREVLSALVHTTLSVLKEAISFAGNLGHVGGSALYVVGHAIQDIGRRANEMLGTLGCNPLKYFAAAIAYALQGIGFAIKNSFGLKPLTNLISSGLNYIRDAANRAILDVKVDRIDAAAPQIPDAQQRGEQRHEPVPVQELPGIDQPVIERLREPLLAAEHPGSGPASEPVPVALHSTAEFRQAVRQQKVQSEQTEHGALLSDGIPLSDDDRGLQLTSTSS